MRYFDKAATFPCKSSSVDRTQPYSIVRRVDAEPLPLRPRIGIGVRPLRSHG